MLLIFIVILLFFSFFGEVILGSLLFLCSIIGFCILSKCSLVWLLYQCCRILDIVFLDCFFSRIDPIRLCLQAICLELKGMRGDHAVCGEEAEWFQGDLFSDMWEDEVFLCRLVYRNSD